MENTLDELKIIYRHYKFCASCKREYGTDFEGDNNWCPICSNRSRGRKSIFDKDGGLEKEKVGGEHDL